MGSSALTNATRCGRPPRLRSAPRHGIARSPVRSGSWSRLHLVGASADPRVSKCPISSRSTEPNDDTEEIHPVGDTHGGLPWKTTMKIPKFLPARQASSHQGSTRIDCHNVSSQRSPSRNGTRSGLRSRAGLGASPAVGPQADCRQQDSRLHAAWLQDCPQRY